MTKIQLQGPAVAVLMIGVLFGSACQSGYSESEVREIIAAEVDAAVSQALADVKQGPQGPPGEQGAPGPRGSAGSIDAATRNCLSSLATAVNALSGHSHTISSFDLAHSHRVTISTSHDGPTFSVTTNSGPRVRVSGCQ